MTSVPIRFADGAVYEQSMGSWTRPAGEIFLNWVKPASGLDWVDVGCGNGAFTDVIVKRCAPASVEGIDPSEGQIKFARERDPGAPARYTQGDALDLPFQDATFDIAAMALVIFFVPDPAKAVAEMVRVVRPGGTVASYSWDIMGGGFPLNSLQAELRAMGISPPLPPSAEASRRASLETMWANAGLKDISVDEITVERSFPSFDALWDHFLGFSSAGIVAGMESDKQSELKSRLSACYKPADDGSVTNSSRAIAIRGRKPA